MKTKLSLLAITIAAVILTTSCNDNNPTNSDLANTIKDGSWRITYYYDADHEETSYFTGYNFTFGSNNIAGASNGTTNVPGTWTTGSDDSQVKLMLNFGATVPFDELNDDWHLIELTNVKIRLDDVSGGGSGTDYLTFEKN